MYSRRPGPIAPSAVCYECDKSSVMEPSVCVRERQRERERERERERQSASLGLKIKLSRRHTMGKMSPSNNALLPVA